MINSCIGASIISLICLSVSILADFNLEYRLGLVMPISSANQDMSFPLFFRTSCIRNTSTNISNKYLIQIYNNILKI